MTKIKYRAWHTTKKIMFSAETMSQDQMCLLPTGEFINVHPNPRLSSIDHQGVMIPLLYMGREDKNGKEIYVGDILKRNVLWQDEPIIYVVEYGQITFDSGMYEYIGFGFRVISGGDRKGRYSENEFMSCDTNDSEIIGNKWENPELLKETNNSTKTPH